MTSKSNGEDSEMDFSTLGSITQKTLPTHPVEIFESLPSLPNTPNDLWRGQAEALENWHQCRTKSDVLMALNTGAGKTIVGLLIAQSLVNEGHKNVLYICSTIDLVKQTSEEATRIGLEHTVRVKQEFNNTRFELEQGFCITNYHALFNGHSSLRKNHFPQAIVFDDAHVAESILRGSYTISIDSAEKTELFNEISQLFYSHFDELGIAEQFKDSISKERHVSAFVAPRGLQNNKSQLLQVFHKYDLSQDKDLTYPFEHLKGHIESCAAIFRHGVFELSPPFLPSRAMEIFHDQIKRVYLSATLKSKTEFIRAFGRMPEETIEPLNDAGNGERLIIRSMEMEGNFSTNFVKDLSASKKVVIAVPNYLESEKWSKVAKVPNRDNFSERLDRFRASESGAFVLVSRVDGIDLPHDTCRLMVIEDLPRGTSLLERYQWDDLKMENVHASRIANRLAQLFGRINRGRNDYGVFLLEGHGLNIWLGKDRNVALLPPLLQKQILLGKVVQEGRVKTSENVVGAIEAVLSRSESWLNYYKSNIKLGELDQEQVNRVADSEASLEEAAISEAKYAAHIWDKEYAKARIEIEKSSVKIAPIDTRLSGWHSVWLGAVYDLENDNESAEKAYSIARERLGRVIHLPKKSIKSDVLGKVEQRNNFYASVKNYFWDAGGDKSGIDKSRQAINQARVLLDGIKTPSANQAEESVRFLGQILGFQSTRPDNDLHKGPDVLWVNDDTGEALAFELKTNKQIPTTYSKSDIGQGHNHIAWFKEQEEYDKHTLIGLVYVGPEIGRVGDQASQSDTMYFTDVDKIYSVMGEVTALLSDLLQLLPVQRSAEMQSKSQEEKWEMRSIFSRLIPSQ